jgi:hypothetical protein
MNARHLTTFALFGAALSLAGCGLLKKKTSDAAPSATAVATAAPTTPLVAPPPEPAPVVAALPALDEAAVPAPQDFEDEAFEKVTTANFKTELARLTKEITTPPAPAK